LIKLKHKISLAVALLSFILCSGLVGAEELYPTQGSLSALDSGYAITRWPWSGGEVLIFKDVTVRACTIDPPYPEATHVEFRWIRPNGSILILTPCKELTPSGDTWKGDDVYDAYDTQTLDAFGDWGVQALFSGPDGKYLPISSCPTVAIKAISWHVVPEVPLGTITILLCMFGAVAIFAIKKKRVPSSPIKRLLCI